MRYSPILNRLVYPLLIAAILCTPTLGQQADSPPQPSNDQDDAGLQDALNELDQDGVWVEQRDAKTGSVTRTMRLTLHPNGEPKPPLKHRLIPGETEMLEGNAALHYLQAMGFLEQQSPQRRLLEIYAEASERARREGDAYDKIPPYAWQSMRPEDLPLAEVQEFLQLTHFQRRSLSEAWLRPHADFDRHLDKAEDIWGYLIPEIQSMRELARLQRLRCRRAIATGDSEDALAILGQQFAMARHLGQDDFIVSAFVGISVAGVAWEDALHLIRQPDAPNLYWAFASMPDPLIDARPALHYESQWLYLQAEMLREVDETPRPAGYWQAFIDRLIPQLGSLKAELAEAGVPLPDDPVAARASFAGMIAAAYPGAKAYLVETGLLDESQIAAYPTAQIVFLAMLRYHDKSQQEQLKWTYLPYWQARAELRAAVDEQRAAAERLGWAALPTQWIGYAGSVHATEAIARMQQQVALIQTIEAIRIYGAAHGGKLPETLADLPVPAPVDPFTGRPPDYRNHGSYATLHGDTSPSLRYRFVLHFSEQRE